MRARELVAAVAIPLLVAAILLLPAWAFVVILGVVLLLAADELLTMARGTGVPAGRWLPLAALVATLAAAWRFGAAGAGAAAVVVAMVLPTAQLASRERPRGALAGAAVATFAVLYVGLGGACLGWLRLLPAGDAGAPLLLFFLGTIWVGDSGAYYVGRNLGRHKMSPRISPNKTWEGLAGGTVATFAAAAVFKLLFTRLGFPLPLAWGHTAALAAILAVAAPVGDLVESQLKRDTGVKDSSALLPGHGGLLDRTDSLIYAAPWVVGYLLLAGVMP